MIGGGDFDADGFTAVVRHGATGPAYEMRKGLLWCDEGDHFWILPLLIPEPHADARCCCGQVTWVMLAGAV